MNITSRQLKAFLLTAKHQSFSRAAEQLFITQSGMSLLVRELETQLGFRLFLRTTRRVKLTEAGVRFLPIADGSLLALEGAAANIGRSPADAGRILSIGATPLLAADVLAPAVAEYAKKHPEIRIRVHDAYESRLIEMVQSGEIDAGVSASARDAPGAQKVPLVRYSLMLIRPHDHAPDHASVVKWTDVAMRRLVGCPPDDPIQQLVDEQMQRAGRLHPPEIVCNYLPTQIAMVEGGAGVAVAPSFAVPACLKRSLSMQGLIEPVVSGHLYWIVRSGHRLSPAAERFNGFLMKYARGWTERWLPVVPEPA